MVYATLRFSGLGVHTDLTQTTSLEGTRLEVLKQGIVCLLVRRTHTLILMLQSNSSRMDFLFED